MDSILFLLIKEANQESKTPPAGLKQIAEYDCIVYSTLFSI